MRIGRIAFGSSYPWNWQPPEPTVRRSAYDFAISFHEGREKRLKDEIDVAQRNVLAMRARLMELDDDAPRDQFDGAAWARYLGL